MHITPSYLHEITAPTFINLSCIDLRVAFIITLVNWVAICDYYGPEGAYLIYGDTFHDPKIPFIRQTQN